MESAVTPAAGEPVGDPSWQTLVRSPKLAAPPFAEPADVLLVAPSLVTTLGASLRLQAAALSATHAINAAVRLIAIPSTGRPTSLAVRPSVFATMAFGFDVGDRSAFRRSAPGVATLDQRNALTSPW